MWETGMTPQGARQAGTERGRPRRGKLHGEAWLLRLVILGVLGYQIATHNKAGATVAAVVVLLIVAYVGALWYAGGREIPGYSPD